MLKITSTHFKKIILSIILLSSGIKIDAQVNLQWAKPIQGAGIEEAISSAADAAGNIYTTGYFDGTGDFDPGPGVYNLTAGYEYTDAFITKFDASGNFVWAIKLGDSLGEDFGKAITIDNAGNVYFTGEFNGTVDFDPGVGVYNITTSGLDIVILKLNSSGNFVWAKKLGGASDDEPYAIAVDSSDNVYTTGTFSDTADFDPGAGSYNLASAGSHDIFVSKLDASGNFVWAEQFGGTNSDIGYAIAVDANKNVYTTGSFALTADFDPGAGIYNLTSAGNDDIFISKLDSLGNFVWADRIGGTGTDVATSMDIDLLGNVLTTGYFVGGVDFDPGAGSYNLTAAVGLDIFISKLNASGNFAWAKQFGGTSSEEAHSITVDAAGDVYTSGFFAGTTDFDPGSGVYNLTAIAPYNDAFVSKLDSAGNFLWAKEIGSYDNEWGGTLLNQQNNIYISGSFSFSSDFDSGPAVNVLASTGGYDAFVVKLCEMAAPTITSSGATTFCQGNNVTLTSSTANSYLWSNGATTQNIVVSAGGNYTVTGTNINGCSTSSAPLTITVNPLPTVSYTQSPSFVCNTDPSVALSPATPSGGIYSGTAVTGTTFNAVTAGTGVYSIVYSYTDVNSCTNTATSAINVSSCTGIQPDIDGNEIQVYPNPANEDLTIIVTNSSELKIFNLIGKEILFLKLDAGKNKVDVKNLSSGIYFAEVKGKEGIITKKIIKQ